MTWAVAQTLKKKKNKQSFISFSFFNARSRDFFSPQKTILKIRQKLTSIQCNEK
jgi:hypothetical protein